MEEKVARALSIIALARFFSLEKTNFTCVEFFRFFVVVATPLISVDTTPRLDRPALLFLTPSPQTATHPTMTATPLGGGGPEGTEEELEGSGDALFDDDESRRGIGDGESELELLKEERETILAFRCFRFSVG